MANVSISQLNTAGTQSIQDLFETAIPDSMSESGYASRKVSMAQIADFIGNDAQLDDMDTTAQTIVGGINELLATIYAMLITIKEQPQDATIDIDGDPAIFAVDAVGIDLSYQWQYLTATASDWRNCSAATVGYNTNRLQVQARLSGGGTRNGYKYRCIVTDNIRGYTVTSEEATLTVTESSSQSANSLAKNIGIIDLDKVDKAVVQEDDE